MKKDSRLRVFQDKRVILVFFALSILMLMVTALVLWLQSGPAEAKVTYVDVRGKLASAKQVWFIFINPGETQVKAYPMKRTGEKQYECSIARREIDPDYTGWIYPSKEYFGEKPIIFDFTPHINSALSLQKI